jgi:glycosyltransferase involved in cell wall biosynthesis
MLASRGMQVGQERLSSYMMEEHVASLVIDVERLKNLHCGLGQYCLHLWHAVSESAPADWEVVPLLRADERPLLAPTYPRWLPARGWRGNPAAHLFRPWAAWLGKTDPCDIWHATHQDTRFLPWARSTQFILTIHDLNILREKPPATIRRRLYRMQKLVDRATLITTASEFAADEIRTHLRLRGKPVEVIPHGVCLNAQQTKEAQPEFLPEGRFLFTIGDVTAKKNFHVLVDLMLRLPEYRLVIAGKKRSDYAAQLEQRIHARGLQHRVLLLDVVSDAERLWLYRNCDAFLFPSLSEGFGLPLIEAMSFGKPIFAAYRTSLPEVGGELACYWHDFEPEHMVHVFREGMRKAHAHPELATRLQARAAEFNWTRAAQAYWAIYQRVREQTQQKEAA